MAQFSPALDFILNNEDPKREYAVVPDPGGAAIAGINSRSWPMAFSNIQRMPQAQRWSAVANFYKTEFWDVMRLGGINSQDLADRVLDEGVNAGPYTATRMLQEAVNTFGADLAVDGILGQKSLDAVNGIDADRVIGVYRLLRLQRYRQIIRMNPQDAKYLAGWEARAMA